MILLDELNRRVLKNLGRAYSRAAINCITRAFVQQISDALVEDGEVSIPGLGRIAVHIVGVDREVTLVHGSFKKGQRKGTRKVKIERNIRVYFSKSPVLRDRLKEKHNGQVRSRRKSNAG